MKDRRTPSQSDLRASIDRLNAEVTATQRAWPERYPVPPEVDALIEYRDDVVRRARSGDLRTSVKETAL